MNDSTFLIGIYPSKIVRICKFLNYLCGCKISRNWLWNVDVIGVLVDVGKVKKIRVKGIKKKDMKLIYFEKDLVALLTFFFFYYSYEKHDNLLWVAYVECLLQRI